MKVLLVNPHQVTKYPQHPLGLAMIAKVLENNFHSVKIIDLTALNLSEDTLLTVIKQEKPDILGVTATTPTINSAARIARKAKEADNEIKVILGGPHGTILPEETLRSIPELDMIVRGEGEQTVTELVRALEDDCDKSQIMGITYRDGDKIKSNPSCPSILHLDQLPFPAFHLLPMSKYRLHPPFGRKTPYVPIITSRGCPFRCVFCSKSVFGKKYRANSPAYIADEIQHLVQKFKIKEVKFYDDVFTLNKHRVIDICKKLKEQKIDILWTCETRVDLVNEELLKIMRNSGCYMIAYGVESGNQKILSALKKDIMLEQIMRAFKLTHEIGIQTVAYFMIGSPEETPETIKETIEFAKSLNPDFVQFSITTPYPGTELYDLAVEKGQAFGDWSKYVYGEFSSKVDEPVSLSDTLNSEDLIAWLKKAYLSFYLRFNYILKRLRKMGALEEIKTNISGLRMIVELME